MAYKNSEGYPDPTSGKAIKAAGHMPTHIYNACRPQDHADLLLYNSDERKKRIS